jgi:hypothetical protein
MTDKPPCRDVHKVIIEMQGSGTRAAQIAKMLDTSESHVRRVWREAKQPVVVHCTRMRREHGKGTGTMRTVMSLLTEEQREAIFKDATDWKVGVPTVIASAIRDAYPPAETEEKP